MTFLLDTRVLFWHLFEPDRLSGPCRKAISEGEQGKASLVVLTLVLAELYFLLRKAGVEDLFPEVVVDLRGNPNYQIETISLDDVAALADYREVPEMHDRLIVAGTNRLAATLLTTDHVIQASPRVRWLW